MLLAPFDPMVCMDHDMVGKSKMEIALSTTLFYMSIVHLCRLPTTCQDCKRRVSPLYQRYKNEFQKIAAGNIYSFTFFIYYFLGWHWTAEFHPFTFQPRAAACKSFLRKQTVYSGSLHYFSSTLRVSL